MQRGKFLTLVSAADDVYLMGQGGSASENPCGTQLQRLIHHLGALPISAAFGLRYIDTLMRRWAASGA
jgi:hypothetical protein